MDTVKALALFEEVEDFEKTGIAADGPLREYAVSTYSKGTVLTLSQASKDVYQAIARYAVKGVTS